MITRKFALLSLGLLVLASSGHGLVKFQQQNVNQSSETESKPGIDCPKDMFKCDNERCIPMSWRCDLESDCEKGEDEKDCTESTSQCNPLKEYQCSPSKRGISSLPSPNAHLIYGTGSLFSHHCIPKEWKCDGEADCVNKDDEANCEEIVCNNQTHFQCRGFDTASPSCIPKEWVCDGQTDCADHSDEESCEAEKSRLTCDKNTEFTCNDGLCIYKNWQCDGDKDCVDGSDEINCEKQQTCEEAGKFKCKTNSQCIPKNWQCDGEPDCADHTDEANCEHTTHVHNVTCSDKEFKCKSETQCISKHWLCDGDADCFDNSDETDCGTKEIVTCASNQLLCVDGKSCFNKTQTCDGHNDCADGSDEIKCPETTSSKGLCNKDIEYQCEGEVPLKCIPLKSLCKSGIANNDCAKTVCNKDITLCDVNDPGCECRKLNNKNATLCSCASGTKSVDKKCVDIDECEQPGICDQICTNLFRSYKCDCYPGYKLTAGDESHGFSGAVPHKCRARGEDPMLLLSNRAAIRQYDIVTNKYHPLISRLESAVAMDFWHKNNTLIWSDVSKEKIMICHIGNQTTLKDISECLDHDNMTLIDKDIATPDGLAIDWVHGLLFWTDTGFDTISVFDLNSKRRKTLFHENLDEPRAIAVDPSAGLIFWTDWGVEARIERAGMNGENRVKIISGDNLRWPNGLALDILDRRVYWADAKMKLISSCDYWGQDVRTVIHSHQHLRHPFSLAVFEEKLYWTDWDQEGVLTVNKFHGNDVKTLMKGISGPMTVRVYHKQAQPEHENKCKDHQCDHLCLPRALFREANKDAESDTYGRPYSCSCDSGFKVNLANSSMCLPLESIAGVLPLEDSSGIPFSYLLLAVICACVLILGFVHYRHRPARFSALQFDNPIYRRTVEELDADLENPMHDNTLGAISILPIGSEQTHGTKHSDSSSKLVISGVNADSNSTHKGSSSTNYVDTTDSTNYSYDQPIKENEST